MPNQAFLIRKAGLRRKNNTIEIDDSCSGKKSLIPILQISEIFALEGADVDGPALNLLSEKNVPIHFFEKGLFSGSWMPFISIPSGQVTLAQYSFLFDSDLRLELAKEIVRGAIRLRCMAARKLKPSKGDLWEHRYLSLMSKVYLEAKNVIPEIKELVSEIDNERRAEFGMDMSSLPILQGLAKATVIGSFARLSLDPWVGVLPLRNRYETCLVEDFNFLFEPLFVDLWPIENPVDSNSINNMPQNYRDHYRRSAAIDGKRVWSLRSLPVREGYALISHFMGESQYRSVRKVEFPQ